LRVVAISDKLSGIDILVEGAVEIDVDGDVRGKVELRVEGASAVAARDARGGGKLPDIGSTGGRAVQALLDTVALVLNQRKGQVDFGYDTSHVKASDISDTPAIADGEIWADAPLCLITIEFIVVTIVVAIIITVVETVIVTIIWGSGRSRKSAGCEECNRQENGGKVHFVDCGVKD